MRLREYNFTKIVILIISFLLINCSINYSFGIKESNQEQENHESLLKKVINIISKWINFAALIFILYFFLVKVMDVPGTFKRISENIIKGIASAKESKESAINQMEEIKRKLSNLDNELQQIKEETMKTLQQEQERIMKEAEAEAKKIREMAHNEIEWRTKEAIKNLKEHTLTLATSISKKIIKTELTEQEHYKLIGYFIKSLKDKK